MGVVVVDAVRHPRRACIVKTKGEAVSEGARLAGQDNDRLTIAGLEEKKHLLYLSPADNTFRDCQVRLGLMTDD